MTSVSEITRTRGVVAPRFEDVVIVRALVCQRYREDRIPLHDQPVQGLGFKQLRYDC